MLSLSLEHLFRFTTRDSRGGGGGRKAGGRGRTSGAPFWLSFAKTREGSELAVLEMESEGEEGLVRRVHVVPMGGELPMVFAGSGNFELSGPFSESES